MHSVESSRQFTRLTFGALFARAAALAGSFAANVMIARCIGAEGKGVLTTFGLWATLLASFFSCGVNLAFVHELGARPWNAARLFPWSFLFAGVAAGVVAVGALFLPADLWGAGVSWGLFVMLFAVQLLCMLSYAFFVGLRHPSLVNWLFAAGSVSYPVAIGLLLAWRGNMDVRGVAVCMVVLPVLMAAGGLLTAYALVRRHADASQPGICWPGLSRYAIKSTVMAAGSILYAQVVMMVLSARGEPADVGVFSVAVLLTDTAMVVPSMITSYVLPRWSACAGSEVFVRASRVMRLTHPVALVIALGAALLGSVFAKPVFGGDFAEVGALVWILIPGTWAATGISVVSTCFLAQDRHKVPTFLAWMGVVLTCASVWILFPAYGCKGAAVGVSVARLTVLALAWGVFRWAGATPAPGMWIPGGDDVATWQDIIRSVLLRLRGRA